MPSIKRIDEFLGESLKKKHGDLWRSMALTIQRRLKNNLESRDAEKAMEFANKALDGHGVEAIRGDYHVDNYHYDIVATYVNMGDTYNATILYETETGRFLVTSYGDWVEKNQRKYQIQ
jgi:hypothetical protein